MYVKIDVMERDIRRNGRWNNDAAGQRPSSCPVKIAVSRVVRGKVTVDAYGGDWGVCRDGQLLFHLPKSASDFIKEADDAYYGGKEVDLQPFSFSVNMPCEFQSQLKTSGKVTKATNQKSRELCVAR